ncbi:unnamed protein product [Closterium sp. NIES-54]
MSAWHGGVCAGYRMGRQEQPNHAKALYRRALARMCSAAFDEARVDLQRMVKADPSTQADATAALAKLKKMEEEAEGRQRRELGGWFDRKPGSLTAHDPSPNPAGAASGAAGAAGGATSAGGGGGDPPALSQATSRAVRRAARKAGAALSGDTGASADGDSSQSDNDEGRDNGGGVEGDGVGGDEEESELLGAFTPVKRTALLTYGPGLVLLMLLLAFGLLLVKDFDWMRTAHMPVVRLYSSELLDSQVDDYMDDEL